MRALKRILVTVFGAWLVLCGLAYLFQRRLQYFPEAAYVERPTARPDLQEVKLETSDGEKIYAWFWPGRRPLTLLVFHGNAGHRGHRVQWVEQFHARGWGVFLLDYRGYGGGTGTPTEEGFYKDADAALEWIEEHAPGRVVYLGRSIGTGVALDLAARKPPAGLILESGAVSMVRVAQSAYWFLPIALIMKDRFDSTDKLSRIEAPALCVHGTADKIILTRLGRELYEAYKGPKEWYAIEGAGHNDTYWIGGRDYYEKYDAFLDSLIE